MSAPMTAEIGFAGLGRMGLAMTLRLLDQGCEVVAWNRSSPACEQAAAAGARIVDRPVDLVADGRVVVTSLFDDEVLRSVYLGNDGLLSGQAQGAVFVDTSTVLPTTIAELREQALKRGADLADSPVLGTVGPARAGQLVAMVGAADAAFERVRPVLENLARRVVHVGPPGSGAATKLAVNIPMTAYWAAMADSFALAARYDVPRDTVLDIIVGGPAAIGQLPLKLDILRGVSSEIGYPITSVLKDIELMRHAAGSIGELKTVAGAMATYQRALELGGDTDVAAAALAAARHILKAKGQTT